MQANCVAPETMLLTQNGHLPIGSLMDQSVIIWDGTDWVNAVVRQTNHAQPFVTVTMTGADGNVTLDVTPSHHFFLFSGLKVRATDLAHGCGLLPTTIEGETTFNVVLSVIDYTRRDNSFSLVGTDKAVFNGVLTGL